MLFAKIVFASELMNLIYEAVEILGGFALVVLIVSYIAHKIKKSKEPKVYEAKVDKTNELKMVLKDEKKNKEIVKGALSTSKKNTAKSGSSSSRHKTSSHHKPVKDKEIASPSKNRKKTTSSRKKSGYSSHAQSKDFRVPQQKKKLPGRDTRIQILNKLSNTQPEIKQKKKTNDGFNKFYDITGDDE